MERGSRLEKEAIERFEKETGNKVDGSLLLWTRDDNQNIAISPDGVVIGKKSSDEEAVEVKCLSASRHIEAYLTKAIPDDYEYQVLQYFIVNDHLKKLHFIFYDPRFATFSDPKRVTLDYFVIEVNRKEVQAEVHEIFGVRAANAQRGR